MTWTPDIAFIAVSTSSRVSWITPEPRTGRTLRRARAGTRGTSSVTWAARWHSLVEPARSAVESADLTEVRDSPAGPRTVAEGLSFPAVDLFIHGWDLGRAVGIEVEIPPSAIAFAHTVIDPLPGEVVRSDRVFGPEVTAQPHFTGTQDFVAWAGRDPEWTRPEG